MLLEDEGSAVEDEEDGADDEVHHGDVVTGEASAVRLVEEAAEEWSHEVGECVDQTVGVIHFVVDAVVKFLVLAFNHIEDNLESFEQLWDDWDEDEVLEQADQWEGDDDEPEFHREVKDLRWAEQEAAESESKHRYNKLELTWELLTNIMR